MQVGLGERQVGEGQVAERLERGIDCQLAALDAREQLLQSAPVHRRGSYPACVRAHNHLAHGALVGAAHFDGQAPEPQTLADGRDAPEVGQHQSRDRLVVAEREAPREEAVQPLDLHRTLDADAAVGERLVQHLALIVLVLDLTDDLLEQILDRDDADRAAVLVDDHRHVEATALHETELAVRELVLRHVEGSAHDARHRLGGAGRAEQIEAVDDADDVVHALVEDRDARDLLATHERDRLLDRGVVAHRVDVDQRHHHLAHVPAAKLEDAADHLRGGELRLLARTLAAQEIREHLADGRHGAIGRGAGEPRGGHLDDPQRRAGERERALHEAAHACRQHVTAGLGERARQ